jgi:chromosome segregation ATPase
MSATLEKLENIISDLEEQTQEIEGYGNVLGRISNVEIQIEQITELSKKSVENLSTTLIGYTDFIESLESQIESQNSQLSSLKVDTKKQIIDFSHEFIEKTSVLRDESLSAHIDLRQDMERVDKASNQVNNSVKQLSKELSSYKTQNSKAQDLIYKRLENMLLEQNKKLSLNNKIVFFIATITSTLLALSLYFSLKLLL